MPTLPPIKTTKAAPQPQDAPTDWKILISRARKSLDIPITAKQSPTILKRIHVVAYVEAWYTPSPIGWLIAYHMFTEAPTTYSEQLPPPIKATLIVTHKQDVEDAVTTLFLQFDSYYRQLPIRLTS